MWSLGLHEIIITIQLSIFFLLVHVLYTVCRNNIIIFLKIKSSIKNITKLYKNNIFKDDWQSIMAPVFERVYNGMLYISGTPFTNVF